MQVVASVSSCRAKSRPGQLTLEKMRDLLCRDRGFVRLADPTLVVFIVSRVRSGIRRGARERWDSRGFTLQPVMETAALRMSFEESASGTGRAARRITFRRPRDVWKELVPVSSAGFKSLPWLRTEEHPAPRTDPIGGHR